MRMHPATGERDGVARAAVLAELVREVYSIEVRTALCGRAKEALESLAYRNVRLRQGDGSEGWPEEAPFDGIIVTAASERVPEPLVDQLAPAGRLIIPVGTVAQRLHLYTREEDGVFCEPLIGVRFVPFSWPESSP